MFDVFLFKPWTSLRNLYYNDPEFLPTWMGKIQPIILMVWWLVGWFLVWHISDCWVIYIYIYIQWNLDCRTEFLPKLFDYRFVQKLKQCCSGRLGQPFGLVQFTLASCSAMFGLSRQSFSHVTFSSARLVRFNSEHLFNHWGIFYSIFFFVQTLNCWHESHSNSKILYLRLVLCLSTCILLNLGKYNFLNNLT